MVLHFEYKKIKGWHGWQKLLQLGDQGKYQQQWINHVDSTYPWYDMRTAFYFCGLPPPKPITPIIRKKNHTTSNEIHSAESLSSTSQTVNVTRKVWEVATGKGDMVTNWHDGWDPVVEKGDSVKTKKIWINCGP